MKLKEIVSIDINPNRWYTTFQTVDLEGLILCPKKLSVGGLRL